MPAAEVSANVSAKVKIVNPIENASHITSRKRALQFVKAGRAVFVGSNLLRFVEADPRNQTAVRRAAHAYASVDRIMTKAEIAKIPLARPATALREAMTDRSKSRVRRTPVGRSKSPRVLVSNGVVRESFE